MKLSTSKGFQNIMAKIDELNEILEGKKTAVQSEAFQKTGIDGSYKESIEALKSVDIEEGQEKEITIKMLQEEIEAFEEYIDMALKSLEVKATRKLDRAKKEG